MTTEKQDEVKPEQCQMVLYDGFIILAGRPPRNAVKTQCQKPAVRDGYCEDCHYDNW
jgi:hypothetical protein